MSHWARTSPTRLAQPGPLPRSPEDLSAKILRTPPSLLSGSHKSRFPFPYSAPRPLFPHPARRCIPRPLLPHPPHEISRIICRTIKKPFLPQKQGVQGALTASKPPALPVFAVFFSQRRAVDA